MRKNQSNSVELKAVAVFMQQRQVDRKESKKKFHQCVMLCVQVSPSLQQSKKQLDEHVKTVLCQLILSMFTKISLQDELHGFANPHPSQQKGLQYIHDKIQRMEAEKPKRLLASIFANICVIEQNNRQNLSFTSQTMLCHQGFTMVLGGVRDVVCTWKRSLRVAGYLREPGMESLIKN